MKSLSLEMMLKTEHWLETSSWLLQGHTQHHGQANDHSLAFDRKSPEVRSNWHVPFLQRLDKEANSSEWATLLTLAP